jgi:magnesium-dependent phosphatase 1
MVTNTGAGLEARTIPPLSSLTDGSLPKLIIFDLDYTLWPFFASTSTPPFQASSSHDSAKDSLGKSFAFYSQVPSILNSLRSHGIKLGAASRTSTPDKATELLKLLHVVDEGGDKRKAIDYFDHMEIYPGSKITHFTEFQRATGLRFEDMLLFDDEERNLEVESLGVTMFLIGQGVGVSRQDIEDGVRKWRERHGFDFREREC